MITHGMKITVLDVPPLDLDELNEIDPLILEANVAKVVLVDDIASAYDKNRSGFLKLLKKNKIEMGFTIDPVSGQKRRCVSPETAERIKELMTPDEIVSFEI